MKVKLPKELLPIFNDFVDACNDCNLTFESLNVMVGETKAGRKGLSFEMKVPNGLTQERAEQIFEAFHKNHPECYLSFNKPQYSELEKVLRSKSETVIELNEDFKLERI